MKLPHWPKRMVVAIIMAQLLLAVLIIQMLRGGTPGGIKKVERTEFLMSTVVEGTIYIDDNKFGQAALSAAYNEVGRLELMLDRHRPASEVSKINDAAGVQPVAVSATTFEVVERALEIGRLTDGSFDITVAPLLELWGFGTGDARVPTEEELTTALQFIDYTRVRLEREQLQVFLEDDKAKIDLGGIAKGFIVDRAVEILIAAGVTSASFDAGGDIRVIGQKPDGTPWRIGVRHPRERRKLIARVELRDQAIVTSGDYERFFVSDGNRYHHILNPDTGFPAQGLISVTVVASDAFTADALSTAIFVLGLERGMALVELLPNVEAILITEDVQVHVSGGLQGKVEITL